jgi:hypothetical protein
MSKRYVQVRALRNGSLLAAVADAQLVLGAPQQEMKSGVPDPTPNPSRRPSGPPGVPGLLLVAFNAETSAFGLPSYDECSWSGGLTRPASSAGTTDVFALHAGKDSILPRTFVSPDLARYV